MASSQQKENKARKQAVPNFRAGSHRGIVFTSVMLRISMLYVLLLSAPAAIHVCLAVLPSPSCDLACLRCCPKEILEVIPGTKV